MIVATIIDPITAGYIGQVFVAGLGLCASLSTPLILYSVAASTARSI